MWSRGMTKKQRGKADREVEEYWREAKKFVKMRTTDPDDPPWFAIDMESPQRWRWEQYFEWRLGFLPIGLTWLRQEKIESFLVPHERPQEFDGKYREALDHGGQTYPE